MSKLYALYPVGTKVIVTNTGECYSTWDDAANAFGFPSVAYGSSVHGETYTVVGQGVRGDGEGSVVYALRSDSVSPMYCMMTAEGITQQDLGLKFDHKLCSVRLVHDAYHKGLLEGKLL